jgi:hypothetical protein
VCLGDGGSIELKFTDNVVIDGAGADLRVVEAGPVAEAYEVFVSSDSGATWISAGTGTGTTDFDISGVSGLATLAGKKYADAVRIVDAGTSTVAAPDKGTDIDNVKALNSSAPVVLYSVSFDECMDLQKTINSDANPVAKPEYRADDRFTPATAGCGWGTNFVQPVAYLMSQAPKVKLVFHAASFVSSATVSATFGPFGTASSSAISFTSGVSPDVSVNFPTAKGSVGLLWENFVPTLTAVNGTSVSFALNTIPFRVYTLLSDFPYNNSYSPAWAPVAGNKPGATALEFACGLGNGATSRIDLLTKITNGFWDSSWRSLSVRYIPALPKIYIYSPNQPARFTTTELLTPVGPTGVSVAPKKFFSSGPGQPAAFVSLESFIDELANLDEPLVCNDVAGLLMATNVVAGGRGELLYMSDVSLGVSGIGVYPYDKIAAKTSLFMAGGGTLSANLHSGNFSYHIICAENEMTHIASDTDNKFGYFGLNKVYDAALSKNLGGPYTVNKTLRSYITNFKLADAERATLFLLVPIQINTIF